MDITVAQPKQFSVSAVRLGQVLSAVIGLFLLVDGVTHLIGIAPVVDSFRELGFDPGKAVPIGLVELACLALAVIPRTRILGAVLLTGYLGGAVCAHFRADSPMLSTTLFPVYLGIAMWVGLYLRDAKVRGLLR